VFLRREFVGLEEVPGADAGAGCLVGIGGADAALGGADFSLAFERLALLVERAVVGKHEMRGIADEEVFSNLHPAGAESLDLPDEGDRIKNDAVADDAGLRFAEDARGDEVQDVFFALDDNCVTGVVAALAADDDFGIIGEVVDDFSFAFIAPLGADENGIGHADLKMRQGHRQARGKAETSGECTDAVRVRLF
jgi:hypothetical protein